MEETIRIISVGYIRIFPELLDRFYKYNDNTIVDLIADKVQAKTKNSFVNMTTLKEEVKKVLNENK